jgi:hypothetical protein
MSWLWTPWAVNLLSDEKSSWAMSHFYWTATSGRPSFGRSIVDRSRLRQWFVSDPAKPAWRVSEGESGLLCRSIFQGTCEGAAIGQADLDVVV